MSSTKKILTNSSVEHTNICQKSSMNVHPLVCFRTVLNQTSVSTLYWIFLFVLFAIRHAGLHQGCIYLHMYKQDLVSRKWFLNVINNEMGISV